MNSTLSSELTAALTRLNPLATSTGKPTPDNAVTFQIGEHEVTQDLTPLGNQTIRKIHDSVVGAPRKIANFLSTPPMLAEQSPSALHWRNEVDDLVNELLKRDQARSITPQESNSESDSEDEEELQPTSRASQIAPPRSILKSGAIQPSTSSEKKRVIWRDQTPGAHQRPLTDVKEFF